jgi:hypothetical protein
MSSLGKVAEAVDAYNAFVASEAARARADGAFAAELRGRWSGIRESVAETASPTGTALPRLALPQTDRRVPAGPGASR